MCKNCNQIVVGYHPMDEIMKDCTNCGETETLVRRPSNFSLDAEAGSPSVGSIVQQSIEDFREDLQEEKRKLKNEFFNPDE